MNAPRHTPGPWELKHFGGPQVSGPNGYAVCTMWGALSPDALKGQDRANANLIVAAPVVLSALEYARNLIGPDDVIDAAIAKARGGAA